MCGGSAVAIQERAASDAQRVGKAAVVSVWVPEPSQREEAIRIGHGEPAVSCFVDCYLPECMFDANCLGDESSVAVDVVATDARSVQRHQPPAEDLVERLGGEGGEEGQSDRGCVAVELGREHDWPGAQPGLARRSWAEMKRFLEPGHKPFESRQPDSPSQLRGLPEGIVVGDGCIDGVGRLDRRLAEVGRVGELGGIGFDPPVDFTRELG
jgi:hypothetical protein